MVNGPLGVTAFKEGTQTVYISRLPDGTPLTYRPTSGTQAYFITEPDGDVAFLADPFGYNVGSYTYSPYGKTTLGGGISQFNPFRWMGEYQETTAGSTPGHYKLGARFYDTNGHFTQPDALSGNLGDPRTMTSYNYAGADPINMADPSGNSIVDLAKKGSKALGKASSALSVADIVYTGVKKGWKKALPKAASFAAGFATTAACGAATAPSVGGPALCAGAGALVGKGAEKLTEKALE